MSSTKPTKTKECFLKPGWVTAVAKNCKEWMPGGGRRQKSFFRICGGVQARRRAGLEAQSAVWKEGGSGEEIRRRGFPSAVHIPHPHALLLLGRGSFPRDPHSPERTWVKAQARVSSKSRRAERARLGVLRSRGTETLFLCGCYSTVVCGERP